MLRLMKLMTGNTTYTVEELADKLDEATGGTRSRPRRPKGLPTVL